MNYDRWNKDKHKEFRRLKRSGYTDDMLIQYFGEDIYYSGMYNRKSTIMPWLEFLTEISITPEYTEYDISKTPSVIYKNQFDYVISFENNSVVYIISLFYYIIDGVETYNVLLTTDKQWEEYRKKLNEIGYKGYITNDERSDLINIVEKETGLNQLYPVMKKTSYILFDFFKQHLKGSIISLGETKNLVKINLYRNIVKNFSDIEEIEEKFDDVGNRYFLYRIS